MEHLQGGYHVPVFSQVDQLGYWKNGGKYIRIEQDSDFDGKIDYWKHIRYPDEDKVQHTSTSPDKLRQIWTVKEEFDRNSDGKPDYWRYYLAGRIIIVERDDDFDGRPDHLVKGLEDMSFR